jgi:hypothetical protein
MYKLTYIVPLEDANSRQYQLVTVTHPQEIVILELRDSMNIFGFKARAWDKNGHLID